MKTKIWVTLSMKTIEINKSIIAIILLISSYSMAQMWTCDIQDQSNTKAHFDSETETFWIENNNERIDLIGNRTISTWQMPKEKCQINSSFDKNDKYDMYSLNYRCSFKVGGTLSLDFKAKEGFYREDLYQGNTRHMYFLKNCSN